MLDYVKRLFLAVDEMLNVLLLNGQPNETISYHAAVAEKDGKRWGCWLCWFLAKAVQPKHCPDQFLTETEPTSAALKAGFLLSLSSYAIWFEAHQLLRLALRYL